MGAERVSAVAYSSTAVPVTGAAGVPSTRQTGATGAVPYVSYEDVQNCTSLKKNGEQCQARPIKDSPYCIGHKRFEEARKSLEV